MQIVDLLKNPDLVMQVIAGGLSFVSGIAALWWKMSTVATRVENIRAQLLRFSTAHMGTVRALMQLSAKLDGREKDILRLEGAFEATRRDQIHLISGLQQAVGSLDAIRRTIQALHPDMVAQAEKHKQGGE